MLVAGLLILLGFGVWELVQEGDAESFAGLAVIIGGLILIASFARRRWHLSKVDRYSREVTR